MRLISLASEVLGLAQHTVGLGVFGFEILKFGVDLLAVYESLGLGVRLAVDLLLQADKS